MKFDFDAKLIGADESELPVYCEVQPPQVGGEKALIKISVPSVKITPKPPSNPGTLSGKCGLFTVSMEGIHWRKFPTSSKSNLGLETIELLHVERLKIQHPRIAARKEVRFHLAPISYLRSESSCVLFGDKSHEEDIFILDLPDLGTTRFVTEWTTTYHRDIEIPGATVIAGFSAVADLTPSSTNDINQMVARLKSSLEILSVLFRQAVYLHGWTYTDGQTVSTWINPLEPNMAPSGREDRGDFIARPQVFVDCATRLAQVYGSADAKTRSLVRHLLVAVNPYVDSKSKDHFLFMFAALERVIEFVWKRDKTPRKPAVTDKAITELLEELAKSVLTTGGENASEISARLDGLIRVVNRSSFREKFEAFLRVYPAMNHYCADLWPVLGSEKERGLREIRHSLAHGSSSFVSCDVVAVAEWHLAILIERLIFVLLDMKVPEGITPDSFLLQTSGRGWYEKSCWYPLRSKPDQKI